MRTLAFTCTLLLLAGCSRNDTECLARIGRKLTDRAKATASELGGKLDLDLNLGSAEVGVSDRVGQRLRGEKLLTGATFDVRAAADGEIELRGTVQNAMQRQRAIEVAEATVGVEKVTDALQVAEP